MKPTDRAFYIKMLREFKEKNPNWNKFDDLFKKYGDLTGIPWLLLKCVAMKESSLRPNLPPNSCGATGLMQMQQGTFADMVQYCKKKFKIEISDIYNPEHSICAGACYLRYLAEQIIRFYKKVIGKLPSQFTLTWMMLVAWNWGIGNLLSLLQKTPPISWDWWVIREKLNKETRYFVEVIMLWYVLMEK